MARQHADNVRHPHRAEPDAPPADLRGARPNMQCRNVVKREELEDGSHRVALFVFLHSGSTSCRSRFAAISQYRSSISMPMARRPRSLAARSVVPEPAKGSSTRSSGLLHFSMIHVISPSGFWV